MKPKVPVMIRTTTATLLLILTTGAAIEALAQKKKRPVYTIAVNSVMHVRLNDELNSEKARIGNTFTATLVDPLYSKGGVELAPQGTIVGGQVTNVKRAEKNGKPAWLDVVFTSLELPNGSRRSFSGSLTDLESSSGSSNDEGTVTAKKTSHRKAKFIGGGAAGGAVIGAIAGGGKGLAIGAGVGAVTGAITGRFKKGHEVKVKEGTEFGVLVNRAFSLPEYRGQR